jgi:hypothetical protein
MQEHTTRQARQAKPRGSQTSAEGASASVLIEECVALHANQASRLRAHAVPAAPSALTYDANDAGEPEPAFFPVNAFAEEALSVSAPVFEPIAGGRGETLLMLNAPGSRARVNGVPAPLVAPLSIGDQVAVDAHSVLHVSRLQSVAPVHPPAGIVGTTCEICLVPFTAKTLVVRCPYCGNARHMEGEDVPEEDRLVCASFGACPHCQAELPASDGYAYWPEDPS